MRTIPSPSPALSLGEREHRRPIRIGGPFGVCDRGRVEEESGVAAALCPALHSWTESLPVCGEGQGTRRLKLYRGDTCSKTETVSETRG